jgi:hypothetical protein
MEYLRLGIIDKKYESCYKLIEVAGNMLKEWKGKENDWRKTAF